MNTIFLRAKHWQIFVVMLTIPFVALIILSVIVGLFIVSNTPERPEDGTWIAYLLPFLFAVSGFVQFAWFWNVLTKLKNLVPDTVQLPARRIKLFLFIPAAYLCLIPLFVAFVINTISQQDPTAILQAVILGIGVFFLHLFSIFCLFHTFFFAAKIIRAAELKRPVTFSDFTADFFLIWFFPVGIWFIQPRINQLIEQENNPFGVINENLVDRF